MQDPERMSEAVATEAISKGLGIAASVPAAASEPSMDVDVNSAENVDSTSVHDLLGNNENVKIPVPATTGAIEGTSPEDAKSANDSSLDHQRVCDRIEQIVNEQMERNLSVDAAKPTPDGVHSPSSADPQTQPHQQCQLVQNTANQCPEYRFENMYELINSGSLFSAEQYLDSCKWSPDGSCLLTCCADKRLRLFDLPSRLYQKTEFVENEKLDGPFGPSLTVSENGAVYDYDWFPFMSSWQPETACFISASSSSPIHLIDAFTGTIRASYTGLNHVFEVASCFGLTFSFDGGQIFGGFRNMIKIFDVAVPGTTCTTLNTKKLNEQTGYISCIAQNPSMPCLFAAGSFSRTVGLYTTEGDAICLLKGQRNGLTSLAYSTDGSKLFSGSRMDPEILCWDLRNPGQVLNVLPRVMDTNQRIRITVTPDGNYLLSGGTDGVVRVWKLDELAKTPGTCEPHIKFKAHNDCVNGVSLNRRYPVLATSSGKRHTPDLVSDEESEQIFSYSNFSKKTENRVTLWWAGNLKGG